MCKPQSLAGFKPARKSIKFNEMKTIEIKVYKFDELNTVGKESAIQTERLNGIDTSFIYSEAKNTVERFCEVFGVRAGSNSLNYGYFENEYLDEILDFTPERLKKYILNNFGDTLFKGKYYSTKGEYINGKFHYKFRHSNIIKVDKNCNLTGVCYDESILHPIYAFLDGSEYQQYNLDELFKFCFESLKNDIDSEIEAMQGDEYISEQLIDNDFDFLESGQLYS